MNIAVYCEKDHLAAVHLIGRARKIANGGLVTALSEGDGDARLFEWGADEQLLIDVREDDCEQGTLIAKALSDIAPDAVLFPATIRGRFLSAWVAAQLQTGLTADCTDLGLTCDGLLLQSRPALGASLIADILCPVSRPQMASVRPGAFEAPRGVYRENGETRKFSFEGAKRRLNLVSFKAVERGVPLQSARIVVAGGKGVGGKAGFEKLHEFAGLLGGVVGATRGAVDAGWVPYSRQIGQTGVIVRPEIYIAFGVSGAAQHLAGMTGAKTVVAVNSDRDAAIFAYADYGIVGDWRETIETMIEYINSERMKDNEFQKDLCSR